MLEPSAGWENFWTGIQLFNQGRYFEAHEVLEDVWRGAAATDKRFLQGLVQLAVAFHHHSTGNLRGARSLIEKARRNLAGYPEEFAGIGLHALLARVDEWKNALADGTELCRIKIRRARHHPD